MIVPDLNLLVYAYNLSAPLHKPAKKWWEDQLNSCLIVGVPSIVLQGFFRLLSGKHVVVNPFPQTELIEIVDEWFKASNTVLLPFSSVTYDIFKGLLINSQVVGSMVSDAVIAAIAIENTATLHSNDSDFQRFTGLKLINPLTSHEG